MNARQRRRAYYLNALSRPKSRDTAVSQAVDRFLADLNPNQRLRWDNDDRCWIWEERVGEHWAEVHRYPDLDTFARAQAFDIPAAATVAERSTR